MEGALRHLLDTSAAVQPALPPLTRWDSGGALVDVAHRTALHDAMGGP
ncbi:MAG TPA: hypothetical protein VNT56_11460 [Acidimicrobiales bacterium]|nr:hypothetical protein [Acidimicrobiales bacterium]